MVSGSSSAHPSTSVGAPSSASLPQNIDDVVSLIHSLAVPSPGAGPSSSGAALTKASNSGSSKSNPLATLTSTLERLCGAKKGSGEAVLLDVAQAQGAAGVEALTLLDPERHSLGLLWILSARTAAARGAEEVHMLSPFLQAFVLRAEPSQWSFAPHRLIKLAQGIASMSLLLNDPRWAVPFLRTIFFRATGKDQAVHAPLPLPATPRTFTPLHHILVYQCLLSREYQAAHEWVLSEPIEQLASANAFQYSHSDILQHFYYAGLVYSKLNQWEAACEAFEMVISCPAQALSAIHVDAYKKLILCQLIKDGSVSPLPSYVSSPITRIRRSNPAEINVYFQLAQLYARKPKLRMPGAGTREEDEVTAKLFAALDSGRAVYEKDANLGLVHLALSLHRQRRIQSLGAVFKTLSTADAVALLGLQREGESAADAQRELELDVQEMVARGWIQAEVTTSPTSSSKHLTFLSSSSNAASTRAASSAAVGLAGKPYETTTDVERLSHLVSLVARSNERVKQREREIARSEGFLRKQQGTRDGRGTLGGFAAAGMDVDDGDDELFV